ncbi:Trypsin Inhibitor like cysteine rich domain protein [Aphelenchoides fujianensis]|nr:Trypsin Inhibitor like cysteine rich domain protein [Aphelenchoides fujianensis]KAI6225340.1 Trypsin Inhibitor like cysteine rich domain protein [Aphelenchoides fujianensis]
MRSVLLVLMVASCVAIQLQDDSEKLAGNRRPEFEVGAPDSFASTAIPDSRCPANARFRQCSNLCPPKHCGNDRVKLPCFSLRCGTPRCECAHGFVRLSLDANSGCVRPSECP